MGFDYDKIKKSEEEGNHWATYSDLFMVLSLVFLLLYVVSSLRSGTFSIQKQLEYKEIVRENEDLKQQLKVYSTLKEDYLQTGASQKEQQMYEGLMDKIVLLKDEAREEKEQLRKAAQENAEKERALNKYQQAVRNIINTNLVAQARIKRRDKTIGEQGQTIKEKRQEISSLQTDILEKEEAIQQGERKISSIKNKLSDNVAQLREAYRQQKISKKKMNEEIREIQKESKAQVSKLKESNQQITQELRSVSSKLDEATGELAQAQSEISKQDKTISQLMDQKSKYSRKIAKARKQFKKSARRAKRKFQEKLNQQKLTAEQKAKKLAEFRKSARREQQDLSERIARLESRAQSSQEDLDKALLQKKKYAKSVQNLQKEKQDLSKNLTKMKRLANAKKRLIEKIKKNLRDSGVKAKVDPKTGDVIISFGDEYFDTGKANLKPGMKEILKEFMPAYSKSLFSHKETAEKIESVEIIGFASPTYKGKYVDPVSLEAENKEAVNYNLDLSYYRARSIFDYIFDTSKMRYQYQKELLPQVKVTGRSFLSEGSDRSIAQDMSRNEYCKKYDCKKAQKVIVKFNLEN